jgi:hypothetical protein
MSWRYPRSDYVVDYLERRLKGDGLLQPPMRGLL